MTTKAKITAIAKKLNCQLVIESDYIEVVAPKGKVISDDVMHYSGFGTDIFSKKEIWERLDYELSLIRDCTGTDFCDCTKIEVA
jgi:hypothetical protein